MLIFTSYDVPLSDKFFKKFLSGMEKNINPRYSGGCQRDDYPEHWKEYSEAHKNNYNLTYEEWKNERDKTNLESNI